jgi:hypothetical protein
LHEQAQADRDFALKLRDELMSRPLDLNELPSWSPWPSRLLGLSNFEAVTRDLEKIDQEYSQDKWQNCLNAYEASGGAKNAEDLRRIFYDLNSDKERAAILEGKLCVATNAEVMALYDKLLINAMGASIGRSDTVVELGSAFGHILWMLRSHFLGKQFRGGDYADSAIALAAKLYKSTPDIAVSKFDFYAPRYEVIENSHGRLTIVTSQALEQVPRSAGVIDSLSQYKNRIDRVFHLEPAYVLYDDNTLLGLLRRKYIEINDYNRDLLTSLKSRSDVKIHRIEPHAVGWNPFNSLALIEWSFI